MASKQHGPLRAWTWDFWGSPGIRTFVVESFFTFPSPATSSSCLCLSFRTNVSVMLPFLGKGDILLYFSKLFDVSETSGQFCLPLQVSALFIALFLQHRRFMKSHISLV